MKSNHYTPIVTNARQGLPLSTANRPRMSPAKRSVIIGGALLTFWGGAALIVSLIR